MKTKQMKTNKNANQLIIDAINLRQIEIATKATNYALKIAENPPKGFAKSMKAVGKIMAYTLEIVELQKIKHQLTPKPNMAKGGMISDKPEFITPLDKS